MIRMYRIFMRCIGELGFVCGCALKKKNDNNNTAYARVKTELENGYSG